MPLMLMPANSVVTLNPRLSSHSNPAPIRMTSLNRLTEAGFLWMMVPSNSTRFQVPCNAFQKKIEQPQPQPGLRPRTQALGLCACLYHEGEPCQSHQAANQQDRDQETQGPGKEGCHLFCAWGMNPTPQGDQCGGKRHGDREGQASDDHERDPEPHLYA